MIERKKKICKSCGRENFLFSHGECRNCYNKRYIAKTKMKLAGRNEKDAKFYEWVWDHREHLCAECGRSLTKPEKGDARNFIHHLLPKSKYPYFRHDERNVVILCFSCHQKAESAISYPKMNIYERCELRKQALLESVGLNYTLPVDNLKLNR